MLAIKENCRIKGNRSGGTGAASKFIPYPNTGFSIGNLTSQVFGNVYMNDLTIAKNDDVNYYGHMDDMVLSNDKDYLQP